MVLSALSGMAHQSQPQADAQPSPATAAAAAGSCAAAATAGSPPAAATPSDGPLVAPSSEQEQQSQQQQHQGQQQQAEQEAYVAEVEAGFSLARQLFAALDAGKQPDFECLRGRPGIRLEPITYPELCALIADGSDRALGSLGRTPLDIKQYWDYRDNVIKKQYTSVTDYLYLKVFGFQPTPGPDGRQAAVVPPGFTEADGPGGSGLVVVWRHNDFPYHLEPGVCHYNLWANRALSREEVEAHIAQQIPAGDDYCWFVNPPAVMSVPSIWHCHILTRQRQHQHRQQGQRHESSETAAQQ